MAKGKDFVLDKLNALHPSIPTSTCVFWSKSPLDSD